MINKHKTTRLTVILSTALMLFLTPVGYAQGFEFEEFQSIPTVGVFDWEFFTIGTDHYLAVANGYNHPNYNIDAKLYRWNGVSFIEYQSIPAQGAWDLEYFTIGSEHYLAMANRQSAKYTYNLNSKIYRWNGASFVEYQSIPTQGPPDWEFFTIGSDHYLAVANAYDGSTTNLNSKLYRWNGASFIEYQSIPTQRAGDWEFFTIGSDHYLVVANEYHYSTHNTNYNINSKLYQWNGASFIEYQSIPTQGAWNWEYFTIGAEHYLAVANSKNDSTHNINSKIYRWNGASFIEYQSIPTQGAHDWEYFTVGSDHYLVVANTNDDSTSNINSKLYRWNGASFVEYQSIPTQGGWDWEYFTIGSDHYLANSKKIYKATNKYEDAYQAGRQACIDDPSSCGIQNCSAPANVATFDITSNVLHIPNFENTYWLKFGLTSWEPVQLELQSFGEIGSE